MFFVFHKNFTAMSRDFSDGDSEPPMTYAMETAELNPFAGKFSSHFRTKFWYL